MKFIFLLIFFCHFFMNNADTYLEIEVVNENKLPINKKTFVGLANEIFHYESNKIGFSGNLKIKVEIGESLGNFRGQTIGDSLYPTIILAKDSIKTIPQLIGVLAHELAHIIYIKWIGSELVKSNYCWDEGFASWLAGQYYLNWHNYRDYKSAINSYIVKNKFIELENSLLDTSQSVGKRDIIYMEWASFIDFLVKSYGIKKSLLISKYFMETLKSTYSFPLSGINVLTKRNSKLLLNRNFFKVDTNLIIERELKIKEGYAKIYGCSFDELRQKWLLSNGIKN